MHKRTKTLMLFVSACLGTNGLWYAAVATAGTAIGKGAPDTKRPGDADCLPRASDSVPEPTWDEKRAAGDKVARLLFFDRAVRQQVTDPSSSGLVAPEISRLARDFAFGSLWSRCGLTKKERSLVTLGILIALRANGQLEEHFKVAERNGLTRRELEETIYQATGYAGFPAGANAREVFARVLKSEASEAGAGSR